MVVAGVVAASVFSLSGCNRNSSSQIDFQMGDRITAGPLTYNVIQTVWRPQLGDALKIRVPSQRFLIVTVSATNGGGREISVPLLTLVDQNGKEYRESDNGEGVDNWFGLLRDIAPAETRQGNLVFDVPLSSYKLRLTDGGEPGTERAVWVDIPLRLDSETGVDVPVQGR